MSYRLISNSISRTSLIYLVMWILWRQRLKNVEVKRWGKKLKNSISKRFWDKRLTDMSIQNFAWTALLDYMSMSRNQGRATQRNDTTKTKFIINGGFWKSVNYLPLNSNIIKVYDVKARMLRHKRFKLCPKIFKMVKKRLMNHKLWLNKKTQNHFLFLVWAKNNS